MTNQPDLAIVSNYPPAFALRPGLILTVVICELPLTLLLGLHSPLMVVLEPRLRPSTCLLMLSAGAGAECPKPGRRLDLISVLVGQHDRNTQRSGSERGDADSLYQLLELERRRRQNTLKNATQPGDLSVELPRPGRGVQLPTVLIRVQGLTLIPRMSASRGTLRTFLLQLLSMPRSLLRLVQTLLTALCLCPGSQHAAIPTSRHRSSQSNNTSSVKPGLRNLPYGDPWREGVRA